MDSGGPKHDTRLGRASVALLVLVALPFVGAPRTSQAQQGYASEQFNVERRNEEQLAPRISGRYVVWQDYRNSPGAATGDGQVNADIYGRNLETDDGFTVTTKKSSARPVISGARLVYTDSRN